ncbi:MULTISPECIES: YhcH/YjgK/YiaL family protein [Vibrio]|uniref:YhcH/YjgK/YiaL family protein n=2 Tax=Vibrio TaxID=662 RepID=A0A7X4RW06_9VIBR|nr:MULTISPECIES: YhcH/YjgK/YiaL family protein [Vibrio]MBF9000902.1 YhcH/YjgK/YiaL family protein [Vibrio nitrifigilis]MZI94855.1 YhcH/YjgK/YiaL family protein [Vibrio eleionomae]
MFIGNIAQPSFHNALSPTLVKLIQQVTTRLANESLANGKYELADDNAFFMLVDDQTHLIKERTPECHQQYLDVQLLLEGEETFGYSTETFIALEQDFLAEKDLAFSNQLKNERFITLGAGDFVVFYPGQPHRPLVAVRDTPAPIRKVIIKVHKDIL